MTAEQRKAAGSKGGKKSRRKGPSTSKLAELQAYEAMYGEPTRQPNAAMV